MIFIGVSVLELQYITIKLPFLGGVQATENERTTINVLKTHTGVFA